MKSCLLSLLFSLSLAATSCGLRNASRSQITALEADLADIGQKQRWLSFAYAESDGGLTSLISKSWSASKNSDGASILDEAANTSFQANEAEGKVVPVKQRLTLTKDLILESFLQIPTESKTHLASVSKLSDGRMKLTFDNSETIVLLVPDSFQNADQAYAVHGSDDDALGIWTTPIGIGAESLIPAFGIFGVPVEVPKSEYFLHHPRNARVEIKIDVSFPRVFIPQVISAAAKWNQALGTEILYVYDKQEITNTADCLSQHQICIRWHGSEVLAWTGYAGVGMSSFAATTGEIIGGVVQISNAAKPEALTSAPQEIDDLITHDWMDVQSASRIFMQREKFAKFKRPKPELLMEWMLLHEIGHVNGFRHDFVGSLDASTVSSSSSVMDYPPFPMAHKLTELGTRDLVKAKRIYQRQPGSLSPRACSDFDSIPLKKDGILVKDNSRCNQYDVGDSAEWFLSLGNHSEAGFLSQIPFPFQIPLPYLKAEDNTPALHVGLALQDSAVSTNRKTKITRELCQNKDRLTISEFLKTKLNVDLNCI